MPGCTGLGQLRHSSSANTVVACGCGATGHLFPLFETVDPGSQTLSRGAILLWGNSVRMANTALTRSRTVWYELLGS